MHRVRGGGRRLGMMSFCGVTRARGLGLRGMNSGRNQLLGVNSLFTMKQMFDSISQKEEEMVEYLRA